ncbi:MAG TPA: 3-phosphoshikimate 1-carboxyvinyltransferase [Candidatus Omnitrophota bacterium]|nr:3-phosphoshikimate 1-carboxyvinyltransferase [Candidatus Omnitrophota bacterium]HPN89087.1 3-phosphoshikimate 1-carboxyvinyltransferase [Candidatus Omnitrophota bacterium]
MDLFILPPHALKGTIKLPASKSYSIRSLIIAACGGQSQIRDCSDCDDAKSALNVIRALGADVKVLSKNSFLIKAFKKPFALSRVNVKESGTVLRFLLPLVSLYAKKALITGCGTLKGRPNIFLMKTLRERGVVIQGEGRQESVPIFLKGGELHGGKITIDGTLSSQFISALLIACPQLTEDTTLFLQGKKLVSSDYVAMTCQILKKAGISIKQKNIRMFFIKGRQRFKGLKNFCVPSDYGLAAFLLGAACLVQSDVNLTGHLPEDLIQADGHILSFLKKMGARFVKTSKGIKIKGPFQLKGGKFSLKNCPDLVPIMAVLALFAKGKTRLYDIAHARAKESDRITDLRQELLKIGAKIIETKSAITIIPQKFYKQGCCLDSHSDHRLAMAFAVLGTKIALKVKKMESTHKSYPKFVKDFKSLGVKMLTS